MLRAAFVVSAAILFSGLTAQDADVTRRLEEARQLKQGGSFSAAAKVYEALLPRLRSSGDRSLAGHALLETGQAELAAGDYPRAGQRAEEAARIFHDLGDDANEALATNVTGSARLYSGDYGRAILAYEHALELDRRQRDGKGEITRLSNIGNAYFYQGKYLDALESYEQGLRRVEETAAEPWNPGRRQLVLTNLAILYEQLGQNGKALDHYKQALAVGSGMPPSEYAQLLSNVGTLYRRMGDAVKALDMYRAAQKLFTREHFSGGEIHVLQNIGIAQALDFHDMPRALAAFSEALRLAQATAHRRETVLAHLFRGEAFYRTDRLEDARRDFLDALAGAREIGATEEQWTALYGRGRIERRQGEDARALRSFEESIAAIESVRSGLGSSSLKAEFLANKRDVYDAAIGLMLRAPGRDAGRLFGMFEQARARNLRDALRSAAAPPTLGSVQSRLHDGSLLIEYWVGENEVAGVWVSRHASGVVNRPLRADEAGAIQDFSGVLKEARDSAWRAPAEDLGSLLLSGIPLEKNITQLLIVPDGILSSVPFELLACAPSAPMLIERFPISYLPSAALLVRYDDRRRPLLPWQRQLVAFGDPVVDARGGLAMDERWSRLPESGRELRSIARPLGGAARIHAGETDQKRYLLGDAAAAPLLHFSTHAAVDTTDPNRSRILFTPEPGKKGSEYLFRGEVMSMQLAADLVTLSACDTEGGRMSRGEGIQSFSRAFLAAGARSTVTTLWRVADGPTADFMRSFYEHLARGETKAEALRAAKLGFLRSGPPLSLPQYWAAFVLNGDGQLPVRPVVSWAWIIGSAGALAILILLSRRRTKPER